jgi:hypothetical protein
MTSETGSAAGLLAWMIRFMGLFSLEKGAWCGVRTAAIRGGHIGSDEHRARGILAGVAPVLARIGPGAGSVKD